MLLWDFADDRSWLHPDENGIYKFATPFSGGDFGNSIEPKPGYYGILSALQGTPDPKPLIDSQMQYRLSHTASPSVVVESD